jgi:hypothetical protein
MRKWCADRLSSRLDGAKARVDEWSWTMANPRRRGDAKRQSSRKELAAFNRREHAREDLDQGWLGPHPEHRQWRRSGAHNRDTHDRRAWRLTVATYTCVLAAFNRRENDMRVKSSIKAGPGGGADPGTGTGGGPGGG